MTTTASFSRACWADVSGKLVFIRNHVECGLDFSAIHVGPLGVLVRVFTMFLKKLWGHACCADVSGDVGFIRNHVECKFAFSAPHVELFQKFTPLIRGDFF